MRHPAPLPSSSLLSELWHDWAEADPALLDAARRSNLERLRVVAVVLGVLALAHLLVFMIQEPPASAAALAWLSDLRVAHTGLALLGAVMAVASHNALRRDVLPTGSEALVWAGATGVLAVAIAISAIDQRVTANITSFTMACLVLGSLFYLRPLPTLGFFVSAEILFCFTQGLVQSNPVQLLSNRVNGGTAALLGATVALLMWRRLMVSTRLQKQVDQTQQALRDKQVELERLARYDPLTGLYNRSEFVRLTDMSLAQANRHTSATGLLIIDLDHFKKVNDTYGHPVGDQVLCTLAKLLSDFVRNTDIVGRLGGEEFIVLLPRTSLEASRKLAEKLRRNIQDLVITTPAGPLSVTASIGVAGALPDQNLRFEHLYPVADKALYEAKHWGRNRVV